MGNLVEAVNYTIPSKCARHISTKDLKKPEYSKKTKYYSKKIKIYSQKFLPKVTNFDQK